jgi:aquaglyceroporin related protein
LNPAITLSQAVFRKFPWRKVPGYMIAQVAGATVATLIVYG